MTAEYLYLFNRISDAIEQLDLIRQMLLDAQQQAEMLYLERTD